jgi:hypothetical protein
MLAVLDGAAQPQAGLINLLMNALPWNCAIIYSLDDVCRGLITTRWLLILSASLYRWTSVGTPAGGSAIFSSGRITFPIVRPALLASAMLNFVRAIESFETPAIIALPARIEVFTTKIYREAIGAPPNQG